MDTKAPGIVAHIRKLEDELKKEPTAFSDELLRQHIRKLRTAWGTEDTAKAVA
jgi:hypothetical protein